MILFSECTTASLHMFWHNPQMFRFNFIPHLSLIPRTEGRLFLRFRQPRARSQHLWALCDSCGTPCVSRNYLFFLNRKDCDHASISTDRCHLTLCKRRCRRAWKNSNFSLKPTWQGEICDAFALMVEREVWGKNDRRKGFLKSAVDRACKSRLFLQFQ